jgi:hypothetical protein
MFLSELNSTPTKISTMVAVISNGMPVISSNAPAPAER